MSKLQDFNADFDELRRNELRANELLFGRLSDDAERRALYDELEDAGYPPLRFLSLAGDGQGDAFLLAGPDQVRAALRLGSVRPYAELPSGGQFMLGLDEPARHDPQNLAAQRALKFTREEIADCARLAVERALVWPQKVQQFDLVQDFAEQVGLRFVALLFGLRAQAHGPLQVVMSAAYRQLCFQIVGRHFVADQPPLPADPARVAKYQKELIAELLWTLNRKPEEREEREEREDGAPAPNAVQQLVKEAKSDEAAVMMIALGLMAGTIGNVCAAVTIVLHAWLGDEAQRAKAAALAHAGDVNGLQAMIKTELRRMPPAPFLARVATPKFLKAAKLTQEVPEGALLLLAMGAEADPALLFGDGPAGGFAHRCIGEHLAWELVRQAVAAALRLPGLAKRIDPHGGQPLPLVKRWGAICERFPVQHARDRLCRQQPLYVVLPIKPPVEDNARILERLTRDGAYVVEDALRHSKHVHFAWFNLVENRTHLAMTTVFDGDFDAYIRHFALKVPLFDKQFDYLDCDQPTPIREHPNEFVATIKRYHRPPLAGYFFSAYPQTVVHDVLRSAQP